MPAKVRGLSPALKRSQHLLEVMLKIRVIENKLKRNHIKTWRGRPSKWNHTGVMNSVPRMCINVNNITLMSNHISKHKIKSLDDILRFFIF